MWSSSSVYSTISSRGSISDSWYLFSSIHFVHIDRTFDRLLLLTVVAVRRWWWRWHWWSWDCSTKTLSTWFVSELLAMKHTHTHTHAFNGPFLGLPGWAGTRKVKPICILLKQGTVSGSGISWAICKSAPRSRQITMPVPHHSSFLQARCPSCRPTNSV